MGRLVISWLSISRLTPFSLYILFLPHTSLLLPLSLFLSLARSLALPPSPPIRISLPPPLFYLPLSRSLALPPFPPLPLPPFHPLPLLLSPSLSIYLFFSLILSRSPPSLYSLSFSLPHSGTTMEISACTFLCHPFILMYFVFISYVYLYNVLHFILNKSIHPFLLLLMFSTCIYFHLRCLRLPQQHSKFPTL